MAARNSILLIVKQQPGIEYNTLLGKIRGSYGSIESARAALSRSIRYLTALGMVARRQNKLYATGKGSAQLHNEMQNRLLVKLNELIGKRDSVAGFDTAVELLQTLIERSKQDRDLLLAARGSVDFHVSDLEELGSLVERRVHSLEYLQGIFWQQVSALKELDFPDLKSLRWGKETKRQITGMSKALKAKVFTAECLNEPFRKKVVERFNAKGRQNELFLESKQLPKFLALIEGNSAIEWNTVNLFMSGIKIKIDYPLVFVTGPYKQLKEVLKK